MKTARLIAVLETELSELRTDFAHLAAQIRGYESRIATLRMGIDHRDELKLLPRTEAILSVLRAADGTLSPSEILVRLLASERDDDLRKVTATIDYLVKSHLITRPSRGRYLAV